jgi:hypothetical protein
MLVAVIVAVLAIKVAVTLLTREEVVVKSEEFSWDQHAAA